MQYLSIFLSALLCLTACSARAPAGGPASDGAPPPVQAEEGTALRCRVVDGAAEGDLLLAGEDGGVYRLTLAEDVPVRLVTPENAPEGADADASALEDGMTVSVAYGGEVLESYPARFAEVSGLTAYALGTAENPCGTCYDLCGLYLQVLEDLWDTDGGLNGGIALLGMDLSRAPGELTGAERDALAWRFGELHGLEVVQGTWEELADQGYIDRENLSWEDGLLFSITPAEGREGEAYSLPGVFFNAEKWRSGLGAYYFMDCSALWPEAGPWTTYTVGAEAIS